MQNQPNQTTELQINLAKFEELAEDFYNSPYCDYETDGKVWIDAFKEFIFSDQLNQQRRRQEYFKLKEQLESMKGEFEPEVTETGPQDDPRLWVISVGSELYKTSQETAGCVGCSFRYNPVKCSYATDDYCCNAAGIIWEKK
jgi:hypothetical protein